MRTIALPDDLDAVATLRAGDRFYLTGRVFTARDAAHRLLLARHEHGEPLPFVPSRMGLYHCGPLVRRDAAGWHVLSAGPTTSMRMEPDEPRLLAAFRPRIVIGKGGMGSGTAAALARIGGVYAHFTGGAGALAARSIDRVEGVFFLEELGMAEAVWILHVTRFGPLLVTIDPAGGNLYRGIEEENATRMKKIMQRIEKEAR